MSPTTSDATPMDTSTPSAAVSDAAAPVDAALERLETLLGGIVDGESHVASPGRATRDPFTLG